MIHMRRLCVVIAATCLAPISSTLKVSLVISIMAPTIVSPALCAFKTRTMLQAEAARLIGKTSCGMLTGILRNASKVATLGMDLTVAGMPTRGTRNLPLIPCAAKMRLVINPSISVFKT